MLVIIILIRWRNEHMSQSMKIMKLNAIPLIIAGASKKHKRMPQKAFHCNIKALGCF